MSYKFNPFTGTLDVVSNNGGGPVDAPTTFEIGDYLANESISALQLVKADSNNQVSVCDINTYINSQVLGVALNAGSVNQNIKVLRSGKVEDSSFTFNLNEPLFLETSGAITATPPVGGFLVNVGHGMGPGAIFIDIQEQIKL